MAGPDLRVELVKRADGGVVLRCVRRDGSATWQRHADRHGAFFALHDLTHLAVESTLGVRSGFFGLIADGWEIADTGGRGARGPLPAEARWVEQLVGLLDRERVGGAAPLSAAEADAFLAADAATEAVARERPLTEPALAAVRARVAALHHRWATLPEGDTLVAHLDRERPPGGRFGS